MSIYFIYDNEGFHVTVSIHLTLSFLHHLHAHKSVLYVCVSTAALQIISLVPSSRFHIYVFSSIQFSRSVVSDSLRPHELHALCEFIFKYNSLNSKFIFKWKYIAYFCHTVLPNKELIFKNLRYEEFVRLWLPIAEICQKYCNYYTLKLIVTVGTNHSGTQFCVTQE